jgi:hypothetical protein
LNKVSNFIFRTWEGHSWKKIVFIT